MKGKSLGKLIILYSVSIISLFGCKSNNTVKEGTKTVNVYTSSSGSLVLSDTIDLRFFKEQNDIPYIAIDTFLDAFKTNVYTINASSNKFTFTNKIWANDTRRTYKPSAYFDISNNAITYDDYTCFICDDVYAYNPLEMNNAKGRSYFKLVGEDYKAGDTITIDLDDYSIKSYYTDSKLYLPLYTAKSLFTVMTTSYFYNGNALYVDAAQQDCEFNRAVRNNLFTPSSKYLEYGYNQFALDIDLHFGMRNFSRKLRSKNNTDYKYMGGTGGNAYSVLAPLKSKFITSAEKFDEATNDFYKAYLDDGGHTGLLSRSYYKPVGTNVNYGDEIKRSATIGSRIKTAKSSSKYGQGAYSIKNELTGDYTVLFIFNQFQIDEANLFLNVVSYIKTNANKIKHIIIDLSNNGGGYIFFSEMLINYLTKGRASNHVLSSVNGSKGYSKFNTNNYLDKEFNSDDYLPNTVESIDIITSGKSFSAANYTACQVAKYGDDTYTKVYIDGENSGGGVCAVEGSMMNCIGMTAQWSSLYRLCEEKDDGNWIGVDDGVTSITKEDGSQVTINGESWNSLDDNEVSKYADHDDLISKIYSR